MGPWMGQPIEKLDINFCYACLDDVGVAGEAARQVGVTLEGIQHLRVGQDAVDHLRIGCQGVDQVWVAQDPVSDNMALLDCKSRIESGIVYRVIGWRLGNFDLTNI